MKPELTNLLHRLSAQLEGFQSLIIFPSGCALANHRYGCHNFANLDAVERFAYAPQPGDADPSVQSETTSQKPS